MANTYKLRLKFGTMSGTKTWNFNYANSNTESSDVKALMDAMIANGSIYKNPPLTRDSADLVQTVITTYNVD